MRYFVKLAYNGAPFFGWQIQPKQISVQEVLEHTFSLLLKEKIDLTGCGRTDTGVHAREYFAHFDIDRILQENELTQLVFKLNSFLPKEIVIYEIRLVSSQAHARYDAISRTYCYYIDIEKDPFTYPYSYRVFEKLDVEAMNQAAALLLQNKDFECFSKVHTEVHHFECDVIESAWYRDANQLIFKITANRFLRNMVRAIVGTLLIVGKGKITLNEFQDIINQKDRKNAGMSVPAHALFLEKIRYPKDIW
jgi:tRNA pseudouridine38-40 synthase